MQIRRGLVAKVFFVSVSIAFGIYCTQRCNTRTKERAVGSTKIAEGLYFENYYVGLLNLDKFSIYLTDSVSFRKFIGTTISKEYYRFEVKNDTVTVRKWTWRIRDPSLEEQFISIVPEDTLNDPVTARRVKDSKRERLIERNILSLSALKRSKVFD